MDKHKDLKRLQIRLPPAMREPLSKHCTEMERSPNDLVLSLLKRYLTHVGVFDDAD
jgi:hypothetical protein